MENQNQGKLSALLPIGVFLVIFLGAGIIFQDFYAMPAIVAFLIALFVAFLQNRKVSFDEKVKIIAQGVGEENIITMSLIFLCAGAFSGAVTAAGGVDSTVNLGLSLIPAHFIVAGLFIISCFISVSMGTSMGTIAALAPIAVGVSNEAGFPMAICIAAVVCGAGQDAGLRDEGQVQGEFPDRTSGGGDHYCFLLVRHKRHELQYRQRRV